MATTNGRDDMSQAKRWVAGRRSRFSEIQIAEAHLRYLQGATWAELGERYGHIDGRNFRYLFDARNYPLVRRSPGRSLKLRVVVPTDPAQLGYIAAMIDGEGHITCVTTREAQGRVGWRLAVTNTDKGLMDWLALAVPGSLVTSKRMRHMPKWPGERLPCYEWRVGSLEDMRAVLAAIEPYLVIKGDRARRAIAAISERIDLNKRPASDALLAAAEHRIGSLAALTDAECRQILVESSEVDAV
jgi:hypothetical protein